MGCSVFQHGVVIQLSTSLFQQAAECHIPSLSGWFAGSVLSPHIFTSLCMHVCLCLGYLLFAFFSLGYGCICQSFLNWPVRESMVLLDFYVVLRGFS